MCLTRHKICYRGHTVVYCIVQLKTYSTAGNLIKAIHYLIRSQRFQRFVLFLIMVASTFLASNKHTIVAVKNLTLFIVMNRNLYQCTICAPQFKETHCD